MISGTQEAGSLSAPLCSIFIINILMHHARPRKGVVRRGPEPTAMLVWMMVGGGHLVQQSR